MSSTTNPNTCPLCLSPLQGTYHHAPPGREWWTWRCLLCDPMETPAYESVETRESLLVQLAALTAERDALAALLKDCRVYVDAEAKCGNHMWRRGAGDILARIDAASGRKS